MPRFVAFLRAVNVGGRVVSMDELRRHFGAAGLSEVETFIASGNVIFSSKATPAAIERKVEAHLAGALGYDVPAFVRTTAEVAAAAARTPFAAGEVASAGAFVVAFLRQPPDAAGLARLESPLDRFAVHGREVYWLSAAKQSQSTLTLVKFERAVGCAATMRSMTSLGKLAVKHCR
ncbi:MAG: DUF1697 domain-containing protein [Vicinamibacterales bacterium]